MNDLKTTRLSRVEAECLITRINEAYDNCLHQATSARKMIVRFIDGDGWKIAGYPSINACVEARFPWSKRTFWRDMEAIRIAEKLGLPDDREIPVGPLLELKTIPEDRQKEAWDAAVETAASSTPTVAAVKEAVRAIERDESEGPRAEYPVAPAVPYGGPVEVTVVGREPGDDDGEVEPASEVFAPEVEEAQSQADDERDFVASLPLLKDLPPHLAKRYVADALGWYRLKGARMAYAAHLRTQANQAKKACASVVPPYLGNQLFSVGKAGASEWRLCRDCDGKGRRFVAGRSTICSSCDTNGYRIK